jgi:hypothetical protein
MKKLKIASIMLLSAALTASLVHGEDNIKVMLDGTELKFDVPPQIIDGRTLVPLRVIFEALGAEVDWNSQTQTVTAVNDDTEISMTIGNDVFYINSEAHTLDVAPQIIDDRTLVPARAVAEGFGAEVDWDEQSQTVIINTEALIAEVTPEPTPMEEPYHIEYESSPRASAHYMKNFEIKSINKNSNNDYDIEYTLQTFLEGRGDVSVTFNCLDANDKVVDTWTKLYRGTDYTWSTHEAAVTISGKTVKIVLVP